MKARSDLMCFWKLLHDAQCVGSPSRLTEDEVRKMGRAQMLFDHENEAVLRGMVEFQSRGK